VAKRLSKNPLVNTDSGLSGLNNLLNKYKIPIALGLVGTVLILGGIFSNQLPNKKSQISDYPKESVISPNSLNIQVDISGAVASPGVYELTPDSRLKDLVDRAGGFLNNANREYISKYLNMAQKLSDASKIYIPTKGEDYDEFSRQNSVAGVSTANLVDLNKATSSQLESLPGIGPSTANKIVDARPYQKVEDLVNKKIVGKAVYEKIKKLVVIK
jgi:competence protein ComEA